jgi:regulator of replication initiation timing
METPKFKVGDILRCIETVVMEDEIFMLEEHHLRDDIRIKTINKRCELWKPRVGEYMWFSDDLKNYTPVLAELLQINEDGSFVCSVPSGKGSLHTREFKQCEPFMYCLSSFLINKIKEDRKSRRRKV